MARATWSGFLSFGLVSVPVGLFSATADQTIHFNQLHKNTSNRVRYKKVDEETGEELSTEDIVNGYPARRRRVRRRHARRDGRGRARQVRTDRDPGLRRPRGDRPDLLSLSPTTSPPRARAPTAPTRCCSQAMLETKKVGIATLVLARQGTPRRRSSRREGAHARDDVLRGRDSRPRRGTRHPAPGRQRQREGALDRQEARRVTHRRVGPRSLQEHLPPARRRAHRAKARRPRRRRTAPRTGRSRTSST